MVHEADSDSRPGDDNRCKTPATGSVNDGAADVSEMIIMLQKAGVQINTAANFAEIPRPDQSVLMEPANQNLNALRRIDK